MIEDVIAQSHLLVDSLPFDAGTIALAALRTISDSQSTAGPFAQLLGVRFEEIDDGRCTATLDVNRHLLNSLGIAHGGVTFSLADLACGCAALSAIGVPRIVTQDMQIRYHGPVRSGTISAQAEVIHHGQRTITLQCRVTRKGILLASGTATFAILSDSEMEVIRGSKSN